MTKDINELTHWIRLVHAEGVGPATARALLGAFGLPENIFVASFAGLLKVVPEKIAYALLRAPDDSALERIERCAQWVSDAGNHIITLADSEYPQALLDTADPPVLLYAKGNVALLQQPALAMVGSRNATQQGMADAQGFAQALSAAGLTIVSGLALGIDAAAHEGALKTASQKNAGSTIAVIGTGADIVYPARNRELAHRIAAAGLIVSEYALGTPAIASNFPRRNRIISGLARGVLVVEAAAQSGSLITARLALEQGRDVFAIPGSIHSSLSKGCHQLIKQGAKLVESAQDVLEELRIEIASPATPPSGATSGAASGRTARTNTSTQSAGSVENVVSPLTKEQQGLLDLLGFHPVEINLLAERAGLDAAGTAGLLLELEMQGLVESLPGARYRRLA